MVYELSYDTVRVCKCYQRTLDNKVLGQKSGVEKIWRSIGDGQWKEWLPSRQHNELREHRGQEVEGVAGQSHAYNPSYSAGRDQEDRGLKPA
jgi:hypothetical protein